MKITIHTDGGSRGNPGKAAVGCVIIIGGQAPKILGKYIGVATNNEAEYTAVITALEWLKAHKTSVFDGEQKDDGWIKEKVKNIDFKLDSKLVVEQLNRNWKIKDARMGIFARRCWKLIEELDLGVVFTHVPRKKNAQADAVVNQVLDGVGG